MHWRNLIECWSAPCDEPPAAAVAARETAWLSTIRPGAYCDCDDAPRSWTCARENSPRRPACRLAPTRELGLELPTRMPRYGRLNLRGRERGARARCCGRENRNSPYAARQFWLEDQCMAKMKRKPRRKAAVPKARAKRRVRRAPQKVASSQSNRKKVRTIKSAAKRVVVSAGRVAKSLAKEGAVRASDAGRRIVARGMVSVADGFQSAAEGVGETTATALKNVADQVSPEENK